MARRRAGRYSWEYRGRLVERGFGEFSAGRGRWRRRSGIPRQGPRRTSWGGISRRSVRTSCGWRCPVMNYVALLIALVGFVSPVAVASEQDAERYRQHEASRSGTHLAGLFLSERLRDWQDATRDMKQRALMLAADSDRLDAALAELGREHDRIDARYRRLIDEANQGDDRQLYGMIAGLAVDFVGPWVVDVPAVFTAAVSAGVRTSIETGSLEQTMLAVTIVAGLTYGTEKAFDALSRSGWDPADIEITADFISRLETEVNHLVHSFTQPRAFLPPSATLPQDLDVRTISQTAVATYASYLAGMRVRPLVKHAETAYGPGALALSDRERWTWYRIAARQVVSESWSRPVFSDAIDTYRDAGREFMQEGVQNDRLSAQVAGATNALRQKVDEYNRVRAVLLRREEGIFASIGKSIIKLGAGVIGTAMGGPALGVGLSTAMGTFMEGGSPQAAIFNAGWSAGLTYAWEELRSEDPAHAGLTDHVPQTDFPDCERVSHPLCQASAPGGHRTSPLVDVAPTTVAADAPTVDPASTLADDQLVANDIRHFGRWDHLPQEREQAWVTLYEWPKELSLEELKSMSPGHVSMRVEFYDRHGDKQDMTVGFWPTEPRKLLTSDGRIRVEQPPPGVLPVRIDVDRAKVLEHWAPLAENAGKVVDQWYAFPISNCVTFVRKFLSDVGVEVGHSWFTTPSDFIDDLPGAQCAVSR